MKPILFQFFRVVRLTGVRAFGAFSVVLLQMYIGRTLGEVASGVFYTSMMVATIAATLACFGSDIGIVRSVSIFKEKEDWKGLRSALSRDVLLSFTLALLCVFCIFIFLLKMVGLRWVPSADAEVFFGSYIYLVVPMSICMVLSGALNGLSLNAISVAGMQLIPYGVALIALILSPQVDLKAVGFSLVVGWCVSVAISVFSIRKAVPGFDFFKIEYDLVGSFKSGRDFFIFQFLVQVYTWTGVAVISSSLALADAGVYGAAQRLSIVISFLLSSYSLMNRPKFAALHAAGDIEGLQKLVSSTTRVMVLVSLVVFFVIAIFSSPLMSLFGKGFERGAVVLAVLSFGQVVNAVLGSVGHVLNMTGHSKDMRNIMLICVPLGLLATWGCSLAYGLVGAAVGSSGSMALVNILIVIFVRRRVGVVPLLLRS